jgi:hypothetical protein
MIVLFTKPILRAWCLRMGFGGMGVWWVGLIRVRRLLLGLWRGLNVPGFMNVQENMMI